MTLSLALLLIVLVFFVAATFVFRDRWRARPHPTGGGPNDAYSDQYDPGDERRSSDPGSDAHDGTGMGRPAGPDAEAMHEDRAFTFPDKPKDQR